MCLLIIKHWKKSDGKGCLESLFRKGIREDHTDEKKGLHQGKERTLPSEGWAGPWVHFAGYWIGVQFRVLILILALSLCCPARPHLSKEANSVCPVCPLQLLKPRFILRGYFELYRQRTLGKCKVQLRGFSPHIFSCLFPFGLLFY